MEALKLGLIVLIILVALRRKVPMGLTLLAMGPITALVYQIPAGQLLQGYLDVLGSRRFISLTGLIVLVTIMGSLLGQLGYLKRLAEACRGLYGGARTAVAVLPPLIGMMPMPGGSYLSAPLVGSILDQPRYSPEFKCVTNYWFRHLIEVTWPIYPGIVLTEAITGMPIASVSLLQAPLTVAMVIIGWFFFIRRIEKTPGDSPALAGALKGIAGSIWPVVTAVLLYGVLKLELSVSFIVAIGIFAAVTRPSRRVMLNAVREGLSLKLLAFLFGVLSFQMVLESSGAIGSIPGLATRYSLPPELIIAVVCFTIGILTGMIAAYVGLGYTLLAGLLYQPVINPGYILIAGVSGFIGFLLSPAHLCVGLTCEYFGADLLKVLRTLVVPLFLLGVVGWLLYMLGYGDLFL